MMVTFIELQTKDRARMWRRTNRLLAIWSTALCSILASPNWLSAQQSGELNRWSISLDEGKTFRSVAVPGAVEDQVEVNFDGVSIYKTRLPAIRIREHQRFVLHFQAVATQATVSIGDRKVGQHLGGWTPFSIDITDQYVEQNREQMDKAKELVVRVDEKVGHNTQGFLPIITQHFGGIWQPVTWEILGNSRIADEAISVRAVFDKQQFRIDTPIIQYRPEELAFNYKIRTLRLGGSEPAGPWQPLRLVASSRKTWDGERKDNSGTGFDRFVYTAFVDSPFAFKRWSPQSPFRYEIKIEMKSRAGLGSNEDSQPSSLDTAQLKLGFREFEVEGSKFRLNGNPIAIRGLLNWGYSPPRTAPALSEEWMLNEIRVAQERGFNLMKFCLWIPPKRYLELCDQQGMMAWVEYPTWHAKLDQEHLLELQREYSEFFEYDRNHCSVVLRSLTCETGPSADLNVIQSLYDLCKKYIPGAVVEDDSSWIQWNRINDFYDDHPYGNNHTWVAKLNSLKEYIAKRERKPLILGEAIAADTWTHPTDSALKQAREHPAHGALSVADASRWLKEIQTLALKRNRVFDPLQLKSQSRHYGMLMRKYQIETYRREVPDGGYVVSVIRDFPKAAMGLIDFENRPKHAPLDWAFQDDQMITLSTDKDRRSFDADAKTSFTFMLKNDSALCIKAGQLRLTLRDQTGLTKSQALLKSAPVPAGELANLQWTTTMPPVTTPSRWILAANWLAEEGVATNEWPIWVFPKATSTKPKFVVHSSASSIAEQLPISAIDWNSDTKQVPEANSLPILARHFDQDLLRKLKSGHSVLMIPDGQAGSFPVTDHWFLRGAPVALPRANERWHRPFSIDRAKQMDQLNMMVELQHFDLAGPVVANIDHYLSLVDPLVLLWDNHDLSIVKTHGLVFDMAVGEGRLRVTTLNHVGQTNSAGRWLFKEFARQIVEPNSWMGDDIRLNTWNRIESEVNRRQILLHREPWKFQPDPDAVGVQEGWFQPGLDDSKWSEIRVDQHWDGQGYAELDHWGWYRRSYLIPDDWKSPKTYLNFTGIDDYAIIYVNGFKVGTAGDLEQKKTAFEERISLDISKHAQPGKHLQITVSVYDWYGAGGIFRPVSLSTEPLSTKPPILR